MSQGDQCPLCLGPANRMPRTEHWLKPGEYFPLFMCEICGQFVMPDIVASRWQNDHRGRGHKLSAFVRERQVHQSGAPMLLDSFQGLPEPPSYVFLTEDAIAAFPRNFPERMDRTLANLARMAPVPGSEVELVCKRDYPVGFAESDRAFSYIVNELSYKGYLRMRQGDQGQFYCLLTTDGWERVAGLGAPRAHSTARQAFVAMWFSDQVSDAYQNGIKPAIEQAGYQPLRIDGLEHNGRIDDRLIAEIRKSHFLVADFTGHRAGVYLEAGFALGIGIEVIWTVWEDHLKDCHFDTRQFNYIAWKNPEDLRQRLRARIEATIIPPTS